MSTRGSLRHKIDCLRYPVAFSILSEWDCGAVVLVSVYRQRVWPCHCRPQWRTASLTASISNQCMWWCWSSVSQDPDMGRFFQLARQPDREASMKKYWSGSGFCSGTPWVTLGYVNHRRHNGKSWSKSRLKSYDWLACFHWELSQNWRNQRCRHPRWMNGA